MGPHLRLSILLAVGILVACGSQLRSIEEPLVQLDGGGGHMCGLARDGRAWCWGEGSWGQLGAGDSVSSTEPVPVTGGHRFAVISAGYDRTCAVDTEGGVWCWGESAARAEAAGLKAHSERHRAEPTLVEGAPPLTTITAGYFHACGLDIENRAWCWGDDVYGELGIGPHEYTESPAAVPRHRFQTIVTGRTHTCALDLEGAAWCWGDNQFGQLGDGTSEGRRAPVAVAGELRFRALAAGAHHTCGLTEVGRAHCWGMDTDGQVGAVTAECGPNLCATAPLAVVGKHRFRSLDAGSRHTCGLADEGEVLCWGERWTDDGAVAAPELESAGSDLNFTVIAAAGTETCGVTRLGRAQCFGAARDSTTLYATLAILVGAVLAGLIMAWERRLIPTWLFLIPVSALIALWVALMVPLLRFWNALRNDETGWFFIMEIFVMFLIISMVGAMGGLLVRIAKAWMLRREA